jgi:hypothetical protein
LKSSFPLEIDQTSSTRGTQSADARDSGEATEIEVKEREREIDPPLARPGTRGLVTKSFRRSLLIRKKEMKEKERN